MEIVLLHSRNDFRVSQLKIFPTHYMSISFCDYIHVFRVLQEENCLKRSYECVVENYIKQISF